jgi:hypothetical protein
MDTELETFYESLDFESNDYFYHITGAGNGQRIIEEGLLVDGTNILDVDNILFTTTIEIRQEEFPTYEDFESLVSENNGPSNIRDTSEMVIIVCPKEYNKRIVNNYDEYVNGTYFKGVIPSEYVLGYIDIARQDVTINPDCTYQADLFYL